MSATTSSSVPDPTAARQSHWVDALRRPAAARNTTAIVLVLAALWVAGAFVVPLVMSVLLAVLLWPVLGRVQRVLRVRALAAVVVVMVATAGSGALLVAVISQLGVAAERLPDVLHLAARDVSALTPPAAPQGGTWERTRSALEELDRSVARATGTQRGVEAAQRSKNASIVNAMLEWMVAGAVSAGKALTAGLLQAGVIVLLTFFLLCTGERLAHGISVWCDGRPLARGRFSPLISDAATEMRHFGAVTLVVNASIGVAVAAVFAAFGVDDAVLWGAVGGALHFVPYAGLAVLMALTLVEVYAAQASVWAALAAVGCVAVVGVVIGTALAAWLQGRAARVDGAVMFGGTVFFSVLWGGWGLVLGPLLVVALHVVLRHARAQPAVTPPPTVAAALAAMPLDTGPTLIVELPPGSEQVSAGPAALPLRPLAATPTTGRPT